MDALSGSTTAGQLLLNIKQRGSGIMRLKADLVLVLVAMIWGTSFVAQRIAGKDGSVFLFNGTRFLLAALLLLPFLRRIVWERALWFWAVVAGAILFVASALQQAAMVSTTAGNAGFLTSLYVILVPLILFIGWREHLHPLALLAVGLAVLGAFLLSTGGAYHIQPGDWLAIAGALFWAAHVVLLGKPAAKFNALAFSTGQFLVAGLLNLAVGLFVELPFRGNVLTWSGAVAYTAIFSVAIGYTLQVWGQKHTPPADAALILSLEAVFAALSGWLLIKEHLEGVQILGCGLIFLAVILAQVRPGKKE
jgi:drug/metabolite transporter (DMT)-like permease